VKDVPSTLMTSHLESTASHVAERKRQLKTAFDVVKRQNNTVIFGGDLNLRDKEVCWLVFLCFYPSASLDLPGSYCFLRVHLFVRLSVHLSINSFVNAILVNE